MKKIITPILFGLLLVASGANAGDVSNTPSSVSGKYDKSEVQFLAFAESKEPVHNNCSAFHKRCRGRVCVPVC